LSFLFLFIDCSVIFVIYPNKYNKLILFCFVIAGYCFAVVKSGCQFGVLHPHMKTYCIYNKA
jgi:hypothetical protein